MCVSVCLLVCIWASLSVCVWECVRKKRIGYFLGPVNFPVTVVLATVLHASACLCLCVCVCENVRVSECMYVCECACVSVFIFMWMCLCACLLCMRMCVWVCVCMCVCVFVCVCVCVCTYIYTGVFFPALISLSVFSHSFRVTPLSICPSPFIFFTVYHSNGHPLNISSFLSFTQFLNRHLFAETPMLCNACGICDLPCVSVFVTLQAELKQNVPSKHTVAMLGSKKVHILL